MVDNVGTDVTVGLTLLLVGPNDAAVTKCAAFSHSSFEEETVSRAERAPRAQPWPAYASTSVPDESARTPCD